MDDTLHGGLRKALDHIAYKNRCSLSDWEERLWQRQLRGELLDPRDEDGRRRFREHQRRIALLRTVAHDLHTAR